MPCRRTQRKTWSETENCIWGFNKSKVEAKGCSVMPSLLSNLTPWKTMESNRSRRVQCSFGSVSFLSLSNFLPEPKTSVSASSHMQVHRERFVPSLMSNFMVLELEAGGGGWDSSRSSVLQGALLMSNCSLMIFILLQPTRLPFKVLC